MGPKPGFEVGDPDQGPDQFLLAVPETLFERPHLPGRGVVVPVDIGRVAGQGGDEGGQVHRRRRAPRPARY